MAAAAPADSPPSSEKSIPYTTGIIEIPVLKKLRPERSSYRAARIARLPRQEQLAGGILSDVALDRFQWESGPGSRGAAPATNRCRAFLTCPPRRRSRP